MELFLCLKNAQHGVIEVAKAAMYVYVNEESVLSSIIVIATENSSLSPTSLFYLAPRIIEANWGCQFGPRVGYLGATNCYFGAEGRRQDRDR